MMGHDRKRAPRFPAGFPDQQEGLVILTPVTQTNTIRIAGCGWYFFALAAVRVSILIS